MKKSLQERLNASLDKALDPPRKRPKQELDALLDEYDDGQALGAQRESAVISSKGIPSSIPEGIPSGIPKTNPEDSQEESAPAKNPRRSIAVRPQDEAEEPSSEVFVSVDATHTASEKIIYSHMYRETISKGRHEGHFGPALLMKLSGIRSRNTVHKALYGLIEKLSVEKVAESLGNPFGPRYRIYGPQEILRRRKAAGMVIDPQTKRITERDGIPTGIPKSIPEGTPPAITKNWDTPLPNSGIAGIPNSGILLNTVNTTDVDPSAGGSSSNKSTRNDDEAFADFVKLLRENTAEITGRQPSGADAARWRELAEILVTELRIAAGRTTVSSVPAFLAEHLRRRLWKLENRKQPPLAAEGVEATELAVSREEARECPDCWGTGMYYPGGFEKGVARCKHERLRPSTEVINTEGGGE